VVTLINCFKSGLLGSGQETCSAQALPFRQLADLLLEVHARPRRLLRQELPGLRAAKNEGERNLAGRRGPLRDCPGVNVTTFSFALTAKRNKLVCLIASLTQKY